MNKFSVGDMVEIVDDSRFGAAPQLRRGRIFQVYEVGEVGSILGNEVMLFDPSVDPTTSDAFWYIFQRECDYMHVEIL